MGKKAILVTTMIQLIPETSIVGAPILSCVHKSIPDIFMDCHMMVSEPEKVSSYHNSGIMAIVDALPLLLSG